MERLLKDLFPNTLLSRTIGSDLMKVGGGFFLWQPIERRTFLCSS